MKKDKVKTKSQGKELGSNTGRGQVVRLKSAKAKPSWTAKLPPVVQWWRTPGLPGKRLRGRQSEDPANLRRLPRSRKISQEIHDVAVLEQPGKGAYCGLFSFRTTVGEPQAQVSAPRQSP